MSTADKRTVATDALETLGTIITDKEKRDAIHLGVDPTIAGMKLHAGDHVFLADGKAFLGNGGSTFMAQGMKRREVGIVDPFLSEPVHAGERFWLVVYPRQITSLRHVWEHPDFPESGEIHKTTSKSEADLLKRSEDWLRDFCKNNDSPSYEAIVAFFSGTQSQKIDDFGFLSNEGEYILSYGRDAHCGIPAEFWEHIQVITGTEFVGEKPTYFSCSC